MIIIVEYFQDSAIVFGVLMLFNIAFFRLAREVLGKKSAIETLEFILYSLAFALSPVIRWIYLCLNIAICMMLLTPNGREALRKIKK